VLGDEGRYERQEDKDQDRQAKRKAVARPAGRITQVGEGDEREECGEDADGGDGRQQRDQQQGEEREAAALGRVGEYRHREGQRLAFQSNFSQNESMRWTMPWNFSRLSALDARSSSSDVNCAR